jgi:Fic family protein
MAACFEADTMDTLLRDIAAKKAELDRLRRRAPHGLDNLDRVHDVELTYTSNAIEGNTLTRSETMMVIEHGLTVGGKPLKDHLEAIDHYDAIIYVRDIARQPAPLTEMDVRHLHSLVVKRSNPDIAARYADQSRFVLTDAGPQGFPSPAEVPALMGDFAGWLGSAPDASETAFDAHRRLVNIHPFNDGNGRTARLLMNLVLIRGGYPPIAIRPEDRQAYIEALHSQGEDAGGRFNRLLCVRLDATLDEFLTTLRDAVPKQS